MLNIAVLVSGGGTNLQALIDDAAAGGNPHGRLALVISSKPGVYALTRAEQAGIPHAVLARRDFTNADEHTDAMLALLKEHDIGLIVLAGYLALLDSRIVAAYPGRIVNVHPSLIPAFCGRGYYGLRVHEAALNYGVKLSGATVHLVNEQYDEGPILMQKAVDVLPGDTPEALQQRVMRECEWVLLPRAVAMLCEQLDNN